MGGVIFPWLLLAFMGTLDVLSAQRVLADLGPGQISIQVESRGYPEPAPANLDQSWIINSPEGTRIKFSCYDVRLLQDNPPSCDQDRLLLDDHEGQHEEMCGAHYDTEFFSTSNRLEVRLITGKDNSGGVQCTAEIDHQTTGPVTTQRPNDEEIWDLEVGGFPRVVNSPNYPKGMGPFTNRKWIFRVPEGERIRFTCSDFRMPQLNPNGDCGDYYLKIHDGKREIKLCGTKYGYSILSSTEILRVEVRTGEQQGGGVFDCEAAGKKMDWYGEVTTPPPPTTTDVPPYMGIQSDEIDSSEHGGPQGEKATTCKCGWSNKDNKRIVGGRETGVNEYPFMASLIYRGYRYSFCGASIITRRHAMTAAHCTSNKNAKDLAIVIGEHDQSRYDETGVTQEVPISQIIEHEQYSWHTLRHDITILVLERPIEFSQFIGPVCLSKLQENITSLYVRNLGWGHTIYNGFTSNVLQKVDTRVTHLSSCNKVFRSVSIEHPTQICTFSHKKASCQGDSGGPVIWLDPQTNRYTQRGIHSFGSICATVNPSVKTDVSAYIDWIEKQITATYPAENLCFRKD